MNEEIRPFAAIRALQQTLQYRGANSRVADDGETLRVRRAADRRHIEDIAVRITRRFQVEVNLAAAREAFSVPLLELVEPGGEAIGRLAVEPFDAHVEVATFAVPVVQELVGATVDVAAGEHDVLVAEEVGERGIDRRHAGVEVPGEVIRRVRPGLQIDDMVGQTDRGRIEQAGVDLVEQLLALEGVLDPLRARIDVGCGASDHGCGAEQRRHVVEQRIRPLGDGRGRIVHDRLVRGAQRVLQRIEHFGQLKAGEALGIEPRDAIAPLQARERLGGEPPGVLRGAICLDQRERETPQRLSVRGIDGDAEVLELLLDQLLEGMGRRGMPAGAQLQRRGREVLGGHGRHPPFGV